MNLSEVAHRMKKPVQTISLWEQGEDSPTYLQLEELAYKIYKRPVALFFFPEPPEEDTPNKKFRTLPQTEIDKLSPRIRYLLRHALTMQINLAELHSFTNPVPSNIIRELNFTPDTDAETMAKEVRVFLKVGLDTQLGWKDTDYALRSWRQILEDHGVYIFKESFQDDAVSAFCLHDPDFPVIFLNNNTSKSRQIFSIFHELAHLVLGTGGIDTRTDDFITNLTGADKKIEILCNRFAGAFLVPDADFSQRIVNLRVNDDNIATLANSFKVSREVILRKYLDRNLISTDYYQQKSLEWIKEAAQAKKRKPGGGNYYLTQKTYLGEGYLSLAFSKYYQKKISLDQLAGYLGVKVKSVPGMETVLYETGGMQP